MRSRRQYLLLVPILLVGAVLAVIGLLPRERADVALWWITGLSGVSILAYLLLARPSGRVAGREAQNRVRHGPQADADSEL